MKERAEAKYGGSSKQNNGNDCGVWVLANPTALTQGLDAMRTNVDNYRHVVATNILATVEGKDMNLGLVRTKPAASQSGSALHFISEPQSKSLKLSQKDTGLVVDLGSNPLRLTLTAPADSNGL